MSLNANIIKNPRITEKASNAFDGNVYTFDVVRATTKNEIKKAIFSLYKVIPTKVNTQNRKPKKTFSKGKVGARGGTKIAIVYLKKGDKIELI